MAALLKPNPYQANYKVGAGAYGRLVGMPVNVLTTEANSQKGMTDIRSEVAPAAT